MQKLIAIAFSVLFSLFVFTVEMGFTTGRGNTVKEIARDKAVEKEREIMDKYRKGTATEKDSMDAREKTDKASKEVEKEYQDMMPGTK